MQKPLKLAIGAAGGLVVAAGVVVITASAAGLTLVGLHSPTAATPTPSPTATGAPAQARAGANPATRAVSQAVSQAEAHLLQVSAHALQIRSEYGPCRATILAAAEQTSAQSWHVPRVFLCSFDPCAIMSAQWLEQRFQQDLKTVLDQDVQGGHLTAQQEQQALKRFGGPIRNWDTVRGQRPGASPSASPSPSPTG